MAHKLIDQTLVVPATTKTTTSLPLTFLDLHFAGPVYVKRLFFYPFAYSTNHFCKTTLPSLKKSLSLTLQHFFPLAGNLISPPPPQKPFILYTEEDSVAFTIIESSTDFNHLSTKQPLKNLKETNHLVPTLTNKNKFDDNNIENDTFILPLLALQVTVFPDHGLCIGITYCHVMDDRSCDHFMKSWSFIHQRGDVVELKSLPCFDREVLRDPRGLEDVFLRDYFAMRKSWKHRLIAESQSKEEHQDFVKAIIVFGKEEIERMKKSVLNQWKKNDNEINAPQFLSKFVVTCAFVWAIITKAIHRNDDDGDDKDEYFSFTCDCRDRLGYLIPEGYFGNCLVSKSATMKRKDMKGENSFADVVKVIEKVVAEVKNEPLKDVEEWFQLINKMFMSGNVFYLQGSPKFNVYENEFGFGRPVKVEMVHPSMAVSLAESGDGEGELEFGLVLKSEEFEYISSLIQQGLEAFK